MVLFLYFFFVVDQVVNIMVKKEAISLKTAFNEFVDILFQITINLVTRLGTITIRIFYVYFL